MGDWPVADIVAQATIFGYPASQGSMLTANGNGDCGIILLAHD